MPLLNIVGRIVSVTDAQHTRIMQITENLQPPYSTATLQLTGRRKADRNNNNSTITSSSLSIEGLALKLKLHEIRHSQRLDRLLYPHTSDKRHAFQQKLLPALASKQLKQFVCERKCLQPTSCKPAHLSENLSAQSACAFVHKNGGICTGSLAIEELLVPSVLALDRLLQAARHPWHPSGN